MALTVPALLDILCIADAGSRLLSSKQSHCARICMSMQVAEAFENPKTSTSTFTYLYCYLSSWHNVITQF